MRFDLPTGRFFDSLTLDFDFDLESQVLCLMCPVDQITEIKGSSDGSGNICLKALRVLDTNYELYIYPILTQFTYRYFEIKISRPR